MGAAATECSGLHAREACGTLVAAVIVLLLETVQEAVAESGGRETGAGIGAVVVASSILLDGGRAGGVAGANGGHDGKESCEGCLNHFDRSNRDR